MTIKIKQIIPVTVLALSTLLGCQAEERNSQEITERVMALKTEFVRACENKLSLNDLHNGELTAIIDHRNKLLAAKGYDPTAEYWWCGNDGLYRASFPQTQFPNPVRKKNF